MLRLRPDGWPDRLPTEPTGRREQGANEMCAAPSCVSHPLTSRRFPGLCGGLGIELSEC